MSELATYAMILSLLEKLQSTVEERFVKLDERLDTLQNRLENDIGSIVEGDKPKGDDNPTDSDGKVKKQLDRIEEYTAQLLDDTQGLSRDLLIVENISKRIDTRTARMEFHLGEQDKAIANVLTRVNYCCEQTKLEIEKRDQRFSTIDDALVMTIGAVADLKTVQGQRFDGVSSEIKSLATAVQAGEGQIARVLEKSNEIIQMEEAHKLRDECIYMNTITREINGERRHDRDDFYPLVDIHSGKQINLVNRDDINSTDPVHKKRYLRQLGMQEPFPNIPRYYWAYLKGGIPPPEGTQ